MATSYIIRSRYDDCSPNNRATDYIDDIRDKHRQTLFKNRDRNRTLQMINLRPSLLIFNDDSHDEDDEVCDGYSSQTPSDACTSDQPSPWFSEPISSQVTSNWLGEPSTPMSSASEYQFLSERESAASPASSSSSASSSCSSNSSSHTTVISPDQVPSYFFETPQQSPRSQGRGNSPRMQSSTSRRTNFKRGSRHSARTSPRSGGNCDTTKVRNDYITLKTSLINCGCEVDKINALIIEQWSALLGAIQTSDLEISKDAFESLRTLAQEGLLHARTVLHILQHGLIFNLRDSMWKFDNNSTIVMDLILKLVQSTPQAVPYMVELLTNSQLLNELEDRIDQGDKNEINASVALYSHLIELMMSQLYTDNQHNQIQPLIPDILLMTGVTNETYLNYSPITTMQRCLTPNLISKLILRCIDKSNQRNENLVTKSIALLANTIKLVHLLAGSNGDSSHTEWLSKTLQAFQNSQLEQQFNTLFAALDRLVRLDESSGHSSQGVNVGPMVARIRNQCQQFLSFYRDYIPRYALLFGVQSYHQ